MDGRLSSGSMMPGSASYGGLDLQGSTRLHSQHSFHIQPQPHQGSMLEIRDNFPLTIGSMHESNRNVSLMDKNRNVSDEDAEDTADDGANKGKKAFPWHRVKWTDEMVRMLITAVSYIGEEITEYVNGGSRRKCSNSQKRGKWKSISKVMAERGHLVSPQQCEDKFNDLNKRYKRLNEILGRGTSCQVVEKPSRLDKMVISEKAKEEVRKILSSKHLHYEEMCSYHNNNRLHLPEDPELQRSLHFALRSRDDLDENNLKRNSQDENDDDDQDVEVHDHDGYEENHGDRRMVHGISEGPSKRMKPIQVNEDACFTKSLHALDCNRSLNIGSPSALVDENQVIPEGVQPDVLSKQWITQHSLQLEEQKLKIQAQMLELEKERFKWQKFSRKKDRELEMMKVENERMKLENQHMELELKRKQMYMENS